MLCHTEDGQIELFRALWSISILINLSKRYLLNVYCVPDTVLELDVQNDFLKSPHLQVHSSKAIDVASRAWSFVYVHMVGGDMDCLLPKRDQGGLILGPPCGLASCGSALSIVDPLLFWARLYGLNKA